MFGQQPVELTIEKTVDATILVGSKMWLVTRNDDMNFSDTIRKQFKYIATGICETKNKPIDIFLDIRDNSLYGVSTIKLERWFDIKKDLY